VKQPHRVQVEARGLWAIALALFVVTYTVSVVPAIMPAIVRDFNTSVGSIQSVLVLFSLVTASFAPTAENLSRHYGRTTVFLTSVAVYGAGIAAVALSPTMAALAASFVVLAGLASASLLGSPWTIADLVFGGQINPRVGVALAAGTSLGYSTGGIVGGFLATGPGWRWSFVPPLIVLLVILALGRSLPKLPVSDKQPIDWVGGLLSFLGFGSIVLGVCLGGELGWWEPRREFSVGGVVLPPFAVSIVPTLLSAGAIALGLFIFWQRVAATRNTASLLSVGLLRKRVFVLGTLAAVLHTLVTTGIGFNLYQFLPVVASLNPFRTALAILPYPVTVTIVPLIARYLRLFERIAPKHIVLAGVVLLGVGITMLYGQAHIGATPVDLIAGLVVMGAGSGLFVSSIGDLVHTAATQEEKPEGSAIYNPAQNLGYSLGRAILGTLFVFAASRGVVTGITQELGKTISANERRQLIFQLQEMVQTLPRADVVATILGRMPPSLRSVIHSIEMDAAAYGLKTTLLLALGLTAVCFLLAMTLPKFVSAAGPSAVESPADVSL
jgi:MFS family permease